jgi:hypothetical protein
MSYAIKDGNTDLISLRKARTLVEGENAKTPLLRARLLQR